MLVKILGGIDIIGSLILFLLAFGLKISSGIVLVFIILFGLKSLFILSGDIASILDLLSCIVLLLALFTGLPTALLIISGFLELQKGVFSLLA